MQCMNKVARACPRVGPNALTVSRPVCGLRRCVTAYAAAAAVVESADSSAVTTRARKYVMVSGKGGVGKTSLSAALAVKYAADGHDTLVVSTDPAHSLGDSLGQLLPGGKPVPIEGTDLPIWGMEIDPEAATTEFRAAFSKGASAAKVRGGA
jgi:Anion-transporting ATPase